MRRLAWIMTLGVVFTLLVASVTLADVIRCTNIDCEGTNEADVTTGNDEYQNFDALAGNDIIFAGGGIDTIEGDDEIFGGEGVDTIFGGDDAYTTDGNEDDDQLDGQEGDDFVDGGDGDDNINNRIGDDRDVLFGNAGSDRLNDADGDGRDVIRGGEGDDVCIGDRNDSFKGYEVERIR